MRIFSTFSEDELRVKVYNEIKLWLSPHESLQFIDDFMPIITSFIRTEKLKLLAEVRERVVGEGELHVSHVCPQDNIGCAKFSQRCQTRNHQNAELNELEAEL